MCCIGYRPKRSFIKAKVVFLHLSVIHPVHRLGGYVSQHALQVSSGGSPIFRGGVWMGVSNFLGGLQFFGGVSNFSGGSGPGGVSNFSGGFDFCFLWGYTTPLLLPSLPLPPGTRHQNTVNIWPVCILLECILVLNETNTDVRMYT